MDTQAIFSHYSHVLDNLLENNLWFAMYFQRPSSIEDISGEDTICVPANINIRFGVSKGCLIDEDYGWCVKFNLEDWDSYNDTYHYCEYEEKIYQKAKKAHINNYFAEAQYIGDYTRVLEFYDYNDIDHNMDWQDYWDEDEFLKELKEVEENMSLKEIEICIPLYAYPRAQRHFYEHDFSEKEQARARTIKSPLNEKNICVAAEFIRLYGFDEYVKLTHFLEENKINDIHRGNVMDINNNFVIIDYSGYKPTSYTESSIEEE